VNYKFSLYRAVSVMTIILLILFTRIRAACSENLTKHINTICEQNVEFLFIF
jgi:hypothetical protein